MKKDKKPTDPSRGFSRNIETIALDTLYELVVPLRQPFRLTPEVNAACVALEEAASPH
ncbi:MAG: hypothetical protein J6I40_02635 [Mailhella sp.]|nr:hypothetical protein [Mailhella sp.]